MNVDFHFHTCDSKINPFKLDFFKQAAARAREQDMAAIFIADHFDNVEFRGIYAALDDNFVYNGHYYLAEGVRFYPGMEVELREGPHLLVSGTRDSIITFSDRLAPYMAPDAYCSLEKYFGLQDGLDLLNIFAHPLRLDREIERVDAGLLSQFDALDLNGKDLYRYGEEYRAQIEQLGRQIQLPVVAGSDTHHYHMLGSIYNQFQGPFETVVDLRRLIQAGQYSIFVHPELHQMIETAQALKRELKRAAKRDMLKDARG